MAVTSNDTAKGWVASDLVLWRASEALMISNLMALQSSLQGSTETVRGWREFWRSATTGYKYHDLRGHLSRVATLEDSPDFRQGWRQGLAELDSLLLQPKPVIVITCNGVKFMKNSKGYGPLRSLAPPTTLSSGILTGDDLDEIWRTARGGRWVPFLRYDRYNSLPDDQKRVVMRYFQVGVRRPDA